MNGAIYEFDGFRLVPGEYLLLRNGEPVPLNHKAFRVLALLVERNGHLVEKTEILDQVWEDSFVEEGALSKAIWYVRTALGDSSKERFIQTVSKRGYRFVFPVSVVTDGSGAFRVSELTGIDKVGNGTNVRTEEQVRQPMEVPAGPEVDVESEQTLPVDPARSVNRLPAVLAGVGIVLLAAVSLYLIFYGPFTTSTSSSRDRGTKSDEAYDHYRQAENLSHRRNKNEVITAMDHLNQAISLDPNFARAWAAKAHLQQFLANFSEANQAEIYGKSQEAIEKALAVDPNLSEAYSARCYNKFRFEFDWAAAENACKKALKLDPDSSVGHKVYASFLFSRGRSDEAIAEARRAIDLQPLSLEHQQMYALALYYGRRYEEEEAQWKRLKELNPTHGFIYNRLFMNAALQGKDDKAFEYLIEKLTMEKVDNAAIERFRSAYAEFGLRGVTMEQIKHPELEFGSGAFNVACLYARVGDKDKAFEYLEKAYRERNHRVAVLQVEPQLDPLHDDPRWADLVRRVEGR